MSSTRCASTTRRRRTFPPGAALLSTACRATTWSPAPPPSPPASSRSCTPNAWRASTSTAPARSSSPTAPTTPTWPQGCCHSRRLQVPTSARASKPLVTSSRTSRAAVGVLGDITRSATARPTHRTPAAAGAAARSATTPSLRRTRLCATSSSAACSRCGTRGLTTPQVPSRATGRPCATPTTNLPTAALPSQPRGG